MFKQACNKQGKLLKKSTKGLVGYQQRTFKVIGGGSFLVYYDKTANDEQLKDMKPDGIFEIRDLENIKIVGHCKFEFQYGPRKF